MTRSIRVLPVIALVLAALTAAFAFSPRAVAASRTPEQIAQANREKAQKIADKALLSIEKALSKGEGRFDNLAEAAIKNMDKLLVKNVRDFAKYQKAVASAVTSVNKDSVKTLAGAVKTIAATQKTLQKMNQQEVLLDFLGKAGQKTAAFVSPSAEAIARMQDRLLEIQQMLLELQP